MLDVLEQKIGLITLLFIFAFQSGLAVSVRVHPKTEDPGHQTIFAGRNQAQIINRWFDVVYLYLFAYEKVLYGSSPAKENITEFYFQESNCTRNDVNNMNKTKKVCTFNPKGKIMICHMKALPVDFSNCKSTGDKYDIPKTDRRSEDYAVFAVKVYNKKNYKPESPLSLAHHVNVMSALKREVSIGTKNVLQFSTRELNCTKSRLASGMVKSTCSIAKPRFDCEATVNEPMTTFGASELRFLENKTKHVLEFKRNVDVKCQENKSPDDAIAMKNMPPSEEKTCKIVEFNPIGKAGWGINGCMRWTDEEDQNLVKPKAGSAVVESSADKEGNNKTSETMSSGSFPKKASTSKLKAKNNLTKAKAKNAAMKMLEAVSERAHQPEEDGAYASSDKGQPPIPPIIPKKLIKKEKAVTKAGGQNTTKTKNKDSREEKDSEDAEEEAKIEKKPLGKASARQEKTNDGGNIVSGGKKKVKVPPEPERFLASNEDKKSDSKPKKGSLGSAGKQKSAAAKERGKNQKKEEKEKNEDEKKHPDDEDKIIKASEPKLNKAKPGKKGSAASNKKGAKTKKEKPALEEEAKTNEKETA